MENVEIPEDFYIIDTEYRKYLCHKSCLLINGKFSNHRYIFLCTNFVKISHINKLRFICEAYDKIEKITHFIDGKFNEFRIHVHTYGIEIFDGNFCNFILLDKALQYLHENLPECIKNVDIKIALKD